MMSLDWGTIRLVGQGRAGKSALARSMMGEPFKETPSTIGGELFEREVREGSVKGGKLAKHKRPEKELESRMATKVLLQNNLDATPAFKAKTPNSNSEDRSNSSNPTIINNGIPGKNNCPEEENRSRCEDIKKQIERLIELKNLPQTEDVVSLERSSISSSNIDPQPSNSELEAPTKKKAERKINRTDLNSDVMYNFLKENLNNRNNLSKFRISVCDFGGQDVFNALHAFFMTRCGVYMLVFDMELFLSKDEKDRESCHENIKFWMNSIAMHTYDEKTGKTAPVALVGTRKDKISSVEGREKISRELQERYENHMIWPSVIPYHWEGGKGFFRSRESKLLNYFPIDNTKRLRESTALTQLIQKTKETMMGSEEVKRKIPLTWIKALDEIRERGKKENKSFLLLEEVIEIGGKLGISLEGVSELLRYLYQMGVLIWIEEPGLREVVILDPIEYFVKPVTRIICKHLASKKDPYAIKHELPIHIQCQRELSEDWKQMLEFGLVSDKLARTLLQNKTTVDPPGLPDRSVEQLLSFMERYGLMIPVHSRANGSAELKSLRTDTMFFVPSLVPEEPDLIITADRNTKEKELIGRLRQRQVSLLEFRPSWTVFLAFSLPSNSDNDFRLFSYDRVEKNGFLPNGLFDRFIARILSSFPDLVVKSNDTRLIAFKNMTRLDCNGKLIRFTNHSHQNMIEIEIEEGNSVSDLRELVEEWLEVVKKLIRECYKCLEVSVLLPVDCEDGKKGLIKADFIHGRSWLPVFISEDGICRLTGAKFIDSQSRWSADSLVRHHTPPSDRPASRKN
jgi:GTPase SAR1 family protein